MTWIMAVLAPVLQEYVPPPVAVKETLLPAQITPSLVVPEVSATVIVGLIPFGISSPPIVGVVLLRFWQSISVVTGTGVPPQSRGALFGSAATMWLSVAETNTGLKLSEFKSCAVSACHAANVILFVPSNPPVTPSV